MEFVLYLRKIARVSFLSRTRSTSTSSASKIVRTVHSNQASQSLWGQLLEHDRVCRFVSSKDLGFHESRVLALFGTKFLNDFIFGLAEGEGSEQMGVRQNKDVGQLVDSN